MHSLTILLVVVKEILPALGGSACTRPMQGIVESLGDFKEVVAAGNNIPSRRDFHFFQQWDQAIQISATPPPTAVEFTILTVLPFTSLPK